MCGLGLWDDFKPLGARKKLAGQIAIAALVYWMGLRIDKITYPGGAWSVPLPVSLSMFMTIFWLIAVPNVVNLIDGFDGSRAGSGSSWRLRLDYRVAQRAASRLLVCLFDGGTLLGFLAFNFPPARIYLGDGGAYLIGFCIAALSLASSNKGSIAAVMLVTVVGMGLPILDTTFCHRPAGIARVPAVSRR